MTYTIMDVPYWSWLPNLTNGPLNVRKYPKFKIFPKSCRIFSSNILGFYIIKLPEQELQASNLYTLEKGYSLFAIHYH